MSCRIHISELWPPVAMTEPAALILGIGSALTLMVASGMLEVVTRLFMAEEVVSPNVFVYNLNSQILFRPWGFTRCKGHDARGKCAFIVRAY